MQSPVSLPKGIDVITIYGPTASGKTAIGCELAHLLGAVLFSADSRQVYRGMDIGSGKDLSEYMVEGEPIPYRMIDMVEVGQPYHLHRYMTDFYHAYDALPRETPKILCGGTGLYITSLLGGYAMPKVPRDEELRAELEALPLEVLQQKVEALGYQLNESDRQNRRRLVRAIEIALAGDEVGIDKRDPLRGPIFCVDVSREVRRSRISSRLRARLGEGLIEEVEGLLERVPAEVLLGYGLEYRYVTEYLLGRRTRGEMLIKLEQAIHQFAKRQMTWVRGMERKGYEITYISPMQTARATAEVVSEYIFNNY